MTATLALCITGVVAGVLSQWLLSSLKFSSNSAEWIFRSLYLIAHLAGVFACGALARRVRSRHGLALLLLAPAMLCLALQWQASVGRDGQNAILLLLLPLLQLMLTGAAAAIAHRLSAERGQ